MALTEKLELLLTADPSQGISALRSISSEAEKTATSTSSSLAKISSAALKVGVGGMGVGGFLTQMASGDVEAANQLDAAIKQVGQSQDDYTSKIDKTVSAMARYGDTDEQVKQALATLTIAYGDTGKALDEMQLTADLAARKQISLGDAATIVARAANGSTKVFKEFGVQVGLNADGTKDLDGALAELARKLSGQADGAANSFTGRLREWRAEAENVVSDFGQNFGPMILGVSTLMTGASGAVQGVTAVYGKYRAAQLANAAAAQAQAAATAEAAAAEAGLATNSAASVASLYAQAGAADAATVGVGGLAAKLALIPSALAATFAMLPAAGAGLGGMRTIPDDMKKSVDAITSQSIPELQSSLKDLAGNLTDSGVLDWFAKLEKASPEAAQKARDAFAAEGKDVAGLDKIIQGANASTDGAKASTDGLTESQQALAAANTATNTTLETQKQRFTDIETAADNAFQATLKLAPADVRVREGALSVSDAKDKQTQAEKDLAAAQASGNQVSIDAARKALDAANLDYTKTVLDEASAVADLKDAQDAANGKTDDASTKTLDYLNALSFLNAGLTGPTHDALNTYIWDATVAYNKTKDLRDAALVSSGLAPAPFHDLSKSAANRATGGSGYPGSTYFIEPGTKGEYFTPTQSGWFTPSDKTSGGGYVIHQIGPIITADPLEAGDQVARRLRIEAMLATP